MKRLTAFDETALKRLEVIQTFWYTESMAEHDTHGYLHLSGSVSLLRYHFV